MGYLLSLFSLSKSATETGLDISEITLLVCGLILAYGAAGEYIEEHGTLPRWMKWSREPRLVFVWMVALSLVGEFVGDAGVFVFSGHLQAISDREVADARRDAASANKEAGLARKDSVAALERASKAEERASVNEKEAAALTKQAEDERIARVELEARVAWRVFSTKQVDDLSRHLRPFAGQRYLLIPVNPPPDPEIGNLIRMIRSVGDKAGWSPYGGNEMSLDVTGIVVEVVTPRTAETEKAATTLVLWLKANNFAVSKRILDPLAADWKALYTRPAIGPFPGVTEIPHPETMIAIIVARRP